MVTNGRMAHDFSRLENWESGRVREDIIRYPARRGEHRSFESFLYLGACMVYSEYSVSRKVVCFQGMVMPQLASFIILQTGGLPRSSLCGLKFIC
jgi:hypothetical protein